MASINRVYAARLARMVVLGPMGESLGRVRDVVVSISIVRQQPRVLGLVVEMTSRRRIFVPILRVTAIEPDAVTLNTASVSLRRFEQRPGEVLVLGQDRRHQGAGQRPRTARARRHRRRGHRPGFGADSNPGLDGDAGRGAHPPTAWPAQQHSHRGLAQCAGTDPLGAGDARPGRGAVAASVRKWRPIEVADAVRELPPKRRYEVVSALDNDRLADILQELSEEEQAELLMQLGDERAADVLEEMDPDDAADLLGTMNPTQAEGLLRQMDPEESDPVRRLLKHSPDTAGGLMTSRAGGADPGHVGRRGAGPGPRSRPDRGVVVAGVGGPSSDRHPDWAVPGMRAPAAAAARATGHAGRRDCRR